MAIDPATLAKQQNVLTMPRVERKCSKCGGRTRSVEGVCAACSHNKIPALRPLSDEHLAALLDACRAELKRRRDALNAALGEP